MYPWTLPLIFNLYQRLLFVNYFEDIRNKITKFNYY